MASRVPRMRAREQKIDMGLAVADMESGAAGHGDLEFPFGRGGERAAWLNPNG